MQSAELLGVFTTTPRVFWYTSNLQPYSPRLIIVMFISNSTIQLTIFCKPWFRHCHFNTQSSRYLNPHDHLQARRYRFYQMLHHCLAPILQVQQLLRLVHYASYHSFWQPRWNRQYNPPNHADIWMLLESPPHMLVIENAISIVACSSTS